MHISRKKNTKAFAVTLSVLMYITTWYFGCFEHTTSNRKTFEFSVSLNVLLQKSIRNPFGSTLEECIETKQREKFGNSFVLFFILLDYLLLKIPKVAEVCVSQSNKLQDRFRQSEGAHLPQTTTIYIYIQSTYISQQLEQSLIFRQTWGRFLVCAPEESRTRTCRWKLQATISS